jgi:TRAP-type C4-dicarboxylate transport system permease small subunit
MAAIRRGLDGLVALLMRGCRFLTVAIMLWLTLVLVTSVLLRVFLDISLTWVDETSSLLLVWLMLAVAPLGFHENFHIAVEVLAENTSPRTRRALGLLINLGGVLFFSITLVFGIASTVIDAQVPLYSLPIARSWMTWMLPASSAAIILVCINNIFGLPGPDAGTETTGA